MRYFLPCLLLVLTFGCQNTTEQQPEDPIPTAPEPEIDLISEDNAAVPLAAFSFADSTLLIPTDSLSPQALFEVTTVVPHGKSEALNLKIQKDLADLIVGDEAPIRVENLPQTIRNAMAT
ncbi:MAG: hypothetical protein AAF597_10060, partial [Bacteroidota bacterium]